METTEDKLETLFAKVRALPKADTEEPAEREQAAARA